MDRWERVSREGWTKDEQRMNKMTARALAVQILQRIEEEKAYANLVMQKSLHDLNDPRERQLTTLLVNGL